MKMNTKKTIATIAAVTMAVSMIATTVSANTNVSLISDTAVTQALANVKYQNQVIPMETPYYASRCTTTYTFNGDIAVKDGGDVTIVFADYDSADFDENEISKVVISVKSGSTTGTLTLVADKDKEDEDNFIYYCEDLKTLCTTDLDNVLTFNINNLSESLNTLLRTNNKLSVGTETVSNGLPWNESSVGWTIKKARVVDTMSVTLVTEIEDDAKPTNKDLTSLSERFDAVTANMTGDVREYIVTSNQLYVAGKYDENKPDAELVGTALEKKVALEGITSYADFKHYVDACGDNGITVTENAAGITDYVKNYLVVQAERYNTEQTVTNNSVTNYWYDSNIEVPDTTAIAAKSAYVDDPANIVLLDIRDSANENAFKTIRTNATTAKGSLNTYLIDVLGYPMVVRDTDYGYADATDYSTMNTHAQLTTALTNVINTLDKLGKGANTYDISVYDVTHNTNKAEAVVESKPLILPANTWVNIGSMYNTNNGYPVLAHLNTLIADNKGVKLRINVDDSKVVTTTPSINTGAFNMTMGTVGAARIRVNGLYATNLSAVATYDAANKCYEFDWDAITDGSGTAWMLELATYDEVGIKSITVSVPDQEAYLDAIGANKPVEDKEPTTDTTQTKPEIAEDEDIKDIEFGESVEVETDEITETPETDETESTDDTMGDLGGLTVEDLTEIIEGIIGANGTQGSTDDTVDVPVVDTTKPNTTIVVENPDTGNTPAIGFVATALTTAVAYLRRKRNQK